MINFIQRSHLWIPVRTTCGTYTYFLGEFEVLNHEIKYLKKLDGFTNHFKNIIFYDVTSRGLKM